jgi:hypothetical protein
VTFRFGSRSISNQISLTGRALARVAGLALLTATASAVRVSAITIARDGAPQAAIVVAKAALAPAKDDAAAQKVAVAAHDLQEYLQKISGAKLPIVGDDESPKGALLLVGRSKRTADAKLRIPEGLTPARREEGFVLIGKGDRLVLAGNDAGPYHGTEYAVYALLDRLGVRWYMPGEFGEYVPRQATITLADMNIRQKPDFIMRNWWLHTTPEMAELEKRWKIRNGMNPDEIFAPPGDSSVRQFVADAKLAATHPEYFAKNVDGTTNHFMPNLTNPQAVTIAADKMKEYFRKNPRAGSLGIAPDDGLPRDFSPETARRNLNFAELGGREGEPTEVSISEEWIEFVNAVTREVKKEFPDRIITTNGYANRDIAPQGVAIDPNVAVMYAAIWSDTLHAYDDPKSWQMRRQGEILRRWAALSDKVWIYGYDYTMLVTGLTPVPTTQRLARDMPLLKKWGLAGFADETRNIWMESGITTKYVQARLEWNAGADVKALLADYFARWYGPAAAPAQAFWDALESEIESTPLQGHEDRIMPYVYTPELLEKLKADVETAERLAVAERDKLHVHVDRLIYEHLKAYMEMNAGDLSGDFARAIRAADRMMECRKELNGINSFFVLPDEQRYDSGVWYWGVLDRKAYYQKMLDALSGKTGSLIAMLSETASFRTDPNDEGRFAGWYLPAAPPGNWSSIRTSMPFYAQGYLSPEGYPYTGAIWYRFDVPIPAGAKGKKVVLATPVVETEAWVWVNGKFVGHRPYHEAYERPNELSMDVTDALMPGKTNTIAIRENTTLNRAAACVGLQGRVFLYSPQPAK